MVILLIIQIFQKPNRSIVKHNNLQSVYIDNNSINT